MRELFCILFVAVIIIWGFRVSLKNNKMILEDQQKRKQQKSDEDLIRETRRLARLLEAKRQAEHVGDTATVESITRMSYDGPLPEYRDNGTPLSIYDDLRIFDIAGINYRGDLTAYVGDFRGTIKPEPTNDYDPFAIMITCEDGHKLGYIREEQTDVVRFLIGSPQPLGENTPTTFPPYRITGTIRQDIDETDGHHYFRGWIYIRKSIAK